MSGRLYCFTGIDGAGKSTQARRLERYLRLKRGEACVVMESKPEFSYQYLNGIALGHGFTSPRELLGSRTYDTVRALDVLRFNFETIAPILVSGVNVVEPRSMYCRLAVALAHSLDSVEILEGIYNHVRKPDLTIWLTIEPAEAVERIRRRGIDDESEVWLSKFSLALGEISKTRDWLIIDGSGSEDEVWSLIEREAGFGSL